MYVFRITPKRIKRSNGTVLTPDMEITVTMEMLLWSTYQEICQGIPMQTH